ncbi:PIN domain-containing protein [Bacillus cereus]|uniref:PIN domain-containing protein n=1 Tax=Bacillus cereus group TaxID=86661 RepID=UPI000279E36E|nr:PIN domain-containing protein [Bacillus cereus]EJR80269.1 hypothetical protein IKA_05701 [Bacillus cereus VD169]
MNFFLDSTVFQNGKDVFMNNRLSNEFFNICKQQKFKIYISTVVIAEIRRQFHTFMNAQLKNIRAGYGAINTVPRIYGPSGHLPSIESIMNQFDLYFKNLEDEGTINIVNYCNDFLPELIHRSIHRIKPFTESKQEFRDAVIWFSYAKLAEEQQLENCYLISGNTTDYLDKNGEIYEELAEKSNKFILFKDMHAILNNSIMEPFKASNELLKSLKEKEWEPEIISNFLNQDTTKSYVKKYLTDDAEDRLAEVVFNNIHLSDREILDIDISNPTRASIEGVNIINKEFVVSGCFEVEIQIRSTAETDTSASKDIRIGKSQILISFDAVYAPDFNTFKNLEISSYEDAVEYWQGVHRVRQDTF